MFIEAGGRVGILNLETSASLRLVLRLRRHHATIGLQSDAINSNLTIIAIVVEAFAVGRVLYGHRTRLIDVANGRLTALIDLSASSLLVAGQSPPRASAEIKALRLNVAAVIGAIGLFSVVQIS